MTTRLLDVTVASIALVVTSPLLLTAMIGIKLTSPGPVLYCARRIGRDRRRGLAARFTHAGGPERRQPQYLGREFGMYKFRTMHVGAESLGPITGYNDPRVFPFGAWLRMTKIDELPQLFNVLKGDMALVGPRPEAPEIVREYYSEEDIATLRVPQGLTSPGALYYYAHCEHMLGSESAVRHYTERLLPVKLELDRAYVRNGASLVNDVKVLLRTVLVIASRVIQHWFSDPREDRVADASVGTSDKAQ
jgi:lipopolysaccharide/colanic/teichoic acid biosynthesis glycosyltransferase